MTARLAASVEATSLIRRAEASGDFAALLERTLSPDGSYRWANSGPDDDTEGKVARFLARRVEFDPDLWAIELDIAQPERFIAETTSAG